MGAMLSYFTVYYLVRELGVVAFTGKEGFGGGDFLYTWLFSPILNLHIVIVSLGIIPLAIYMVLLGLRVTLEQPGKLVLVNGPPALKFSHFSGWTLLVSVVLSIVLFLLRIIFKPPTVGLFIAWFLLCVSLGLVLIGMEWLFGTLFPDGERRHRVIGTLTMSLCLIALVTSTATYLMLYVIWPPVH